MNEARRYIHFAFNSILTLLDFVFIGNTFHNTINMPYGPHTNKTLITTSKTTQYNVPAMFYISA